MNSQELNMTKRLRRITLSTKLMFTKSNNASQKVILINSQPFESFKEVKIYNDENIKKNHEVIKEESLKTLLFFNSEKSFIKNKQKNKNTLKVLSKISYHKMDDISPVTADENRGNFYKRSSLFNILKFSNNKSLSTKNHTSKLSYNLFLNKKSVNISHQLKFNTTLK